MKTLLLFASLLFFAPIQSSPLSSYPYLTGETLKAACDHVYEGQSGEFNARAIKAHDVIFVRGNPQHLGTFFQKFHKEIKVPYRLVTSNSDYPAPGKFGRYLDDPKLEKWFAVNVDGLRHPKLIPIPRGMPNRNLDFGNPEVFMRVQPLAENKDRPYLAYLNFRPYTHPNERNYVFDVFKDYAWAVSPGTKPSEEYLTDLTLSKFVISPRGNGLDCYRTWEALVMGAIPVVKTSDMDPMFDDLPVLIITDWTLVTEDFLNEQYEAFQKREYNKDKLWADWWIQLFHS